MDPVLRLRAQRDQAVALGDWNLVTEIDFALARYGVGPAQVETAVAPTEQAVPVKRGPGRPRKNPVPGKAA